MQIHFQKTWQKHYAVVVVRFALHPTISETSKRVLTCLYASHAEITFLLAGPTTMGIVHSLASTRTVFSHSRLHGLHLPRHLGKGVSQVLATSHAAKLWLVPYHYGPVIEANTTSLFTRQCWSVSWRTDGTALDQLYVLGPSSITRAPVFDLDVADRMAAEQWITLYHLLTRRVQTLHAVRRLRGSC